MIVGADGFPMLTASEARDLIDHRVEAIKRDWDEVCERARTTDAERSFFWRQFLTPTPSRGTRACMLIFP